MANGSERNAAKHQRAESLITLYTDFLVSFQSALYYNESYWSGVAAAYKTASTHKASPEWTAKRERAEHDFRDAAWRLRLREQNPEQQERIERIVSAFDFDPDPEVSGGMDAYALSFPTTATQVRSEMRSIINAMQAIHRSELQSI